MCTGYRGYRGTVGCVPHACARAHASALTRSHPYKSLRAGQASLDYTRNICPNRPKDSALLLPAVLTLGVDQHAVAPNARAQPNDGARDDGASAYAHRRRACSR